MPKEFHLENIRVGPTKRNFGRNLGGSVFATENIVMEET